MTLALLAGAGVGVGLMLLVAGWRPAAPTVASVLAELDAARWSPPPAQASDERSGVLRRLTGWLVRHGGDRSWSSPSLRADLAVLDDDVESLLTRKVTGGLVGVLVPPAVAVALSAVGTGVPVRVPVWAALTAGAVAFLLPDVRLRQTATARRRSFRTAMSGYLDLVAMRIASGAGLAEALSDAANVGPGFAFASLRATLLDARTDGLTPAAALRRLGEQLVLPDLVDTATRLSLVDSSGAQAARSLQAQAASLRDRELTDTQGRANERSQSMLVAQVVLGLGFVVFLGYPAVAKVLAT